MEAKKKCQKLGVSFATVNRWENAHHEPTPAFTNFCVWESSDLTFQKKRKEQSIKRRLTYQLSSFDDLDNA